jgi:uncharacterized protein (DUF4415 family)
MKKQYDFSTAKRAKDVPHLAKLQAAAKAGAVISTPNKTRVTMYLDAQIVEAFKARAQAEGKGYQTAINEALRASVNSNDAPLTVQTLRKELKSAFKQLSAA